MFLRYLGTLCVFLFAVVAFSQNDTLKTIKRTYVTAPLDVKEVITVDGFISEDGWDTVPWASDFTVFDPNNGESPKQRTKFKIVYDSKFIYVGVRCYDNIPKDIERRLARRDNFAGDWIEINFDSYNDKRTGFSFNVSAAGVKGDEFISQNCNNWDPSWNPIWYTATNIDDEGWTAEMKIPFSQIKFGEQKEQVWGLQLNRRLFREEERSLWQPVKREAPGWVSEWNLKRLVKYTTAKAVGNSTFCC